MQRIDLKEAQKNPEYFAFIEHAFKEHGLEYIQEPISDEKAIEHAEHINAGNWTQLNLDDPEFTRNIYKSLRLKKINTNQAATAILLKDARNELCDLKEAKSIRQFKWGDGPYNPQTISYASSEHIQEFHARLKQINPSEQCYFTLDLSKKLEAAFFFLMLTPHWDIKKHIEDSRFIPLLKKYINRNFKKDEPQYKEIMKLVDQDISGRSLALTIFEHGPFGNWLCGRRKKFDISRQSIELISEVIRMNMEHPNWVLSPNFDENNPDSPMISIVLPTMAALNELQAALHGEDVTEPHFVFGEVSTRLIRALDEFPEKFGKKHQARPVQLIHPDVKKNGRPPHGLEAHPFSLAFHDLFHCWQNSINQIKPFCRYLRKLFQTETSFDMSKPLWFLTDMDFSTIGLKKLRINSELKKVWHKKLAINVVNGIIKDTESQYPEFFLDTDRFDDHLLLVIDMIQNKEKWKHFLGQYPVDFFKIATESEKSEINTDLEKFHSVYAETEKLLTSEHEQKTESTSNKPVCYYILLYRLTHNGIALEEAKQLCDQIIAIDKKLANEAKVLQWQRDKFTSHKNVITINKKYLNQETESIVELHPKKLVDILSIALTIATAYVRNEARFFKEAESKKCDDKKPAEKTSISASPLKKIYAE